MQGKRKNDARIGGEESDSKIGRESEMQREQTFQHNTLKSSCRSCLDFYSQKTRVTPTSQSTNAGL